MTARDILFCFILGLSVVSLIPTLHPAETLSLTDLTASVIWLEADIQQRELTALLKIRVLADFDTYSKLVFLLGQRSDTYSFLTFYLETMTPSLYTSLTDGRYLDAFEDADRGVLTRVKYLIFAKSSTQPYTTIGWRSYAPIGSYLEQFQTLNGVNILYDDQYLVICDVSAEDS